MVRNEKKQVSFKVVPDTKEGVKGMVKIYFRILIDGKKKDYNTGIKWPRLFFDFEKQCLIKRFKGDPDVEPYNLKLGEFKNIAHRLSLDAFVQGFTVTFAKIIAEFEQLGSSDNFFSFMNDEIDSLYRENVIGYETRCRHHSTLKTFKEFCGVPHLPMNAINLELVERFDGWARNVKERLHNTVCGYHKDIKKYLNRALERKLIKETPYDKFSFAYQDGDREALTKEELIKLKKLLEEKRLDRNTREVLRRFMFSCLTGVRISDTHVLKKDHIKGNVLVFKPKKGANKYGKILKLPLSDTAMSLIEDAEDLLFAPFSSTYINETLKFIAARAGIFKRLTYHCARDTFGTLMIEMGADLKSLSDLMGHGNMKTTMIYLKMGDERKKMLMKNFDSLL